MLVEKSSILISIRPRRSCWLTAPHMTNNDAKRMLQQIVFLLNFLYSGYNAYDNTSWWNSNLSLLPQITTLSDHIPRALHLFLVMLRVDFFEERFLDSSLLLRNFDPTSKVYKRKAFQTCSADSTRFSRRADIRWEDGVVGEVIYRFILCIGILS